MTKIFHIQELENAHFHILVKNEIMSKNDEK